MNTKKTTPSILAILFIIFSALPIHASNVELGVTLVGPTGLAGKVWIDKKTAIDAAFTGDINSENGHFYFHADYLRHRYTSFTVDGGEMPAYWGVGAKTTLGIFNSVSARFPIGVTYLYGQPIFDIFFELAPFVTVYPDLHIGLDGAMGFRFFL